MTHDVPPYTVGGGIPYCLGGINRIGLKRRAFSFASRRALASAYRIVYRSHLHLAEALIVIENEIEPLPEVLHFVDFCKSTKRGLIGMQGIRQRSPSNLTIPSKHEYEASEDLLVEMGAR